MKQTNFQNVCTFLLLLFLSMSSFGQNAKTLIKKADAFYDAQAYELAIPIYRDVLISENSLSAKIKLADCYRLINDYDKAEYWYNQLVNIVPNEPQYKLYYAQMLQSNEKYTEAYKWFMEYGKYDVWGEKLANGCQNTEVFKETDSKYEVLLLPLNSEGSDFGPIYFKNGIIFCSNGNGSTDKERTFMDLYYSDAKSNNTFSTPEKVNGSVNSKLNDGPASFCSLTNELFFSRNATIGEDGKIQNDDNAAVNLSLFTVKLNNNKWGEIKPFMHNSPSFSIAHAAVSPDGKTLYFASNMPGGFGGTDLYVCLRMNNAWSKPVNLGKTVNTPGNEAFPYVHTDGLLYFASNGHPGLGGLDIFTSKNKDGYWSQPKNLGAPFNSSKDDFSITMNTPKSKGYFASNRTGGFGSDDVYSFSLISSEKRVKAVEQPPISNTIINQSIGMGTIRFKRGDTEILPDAAKELDKLAFFLQKNPEVTVELSSHTDIRGDDFNNLDLSSNRSKAARDYVVSKNVPLHRVIARGYGESQILNDCVTVRSCDESEHEINNRIDVRVLSIEGANNDPYAAYMNENDGKSLTLDKTANNSMTFKVLIGPYRSVDNSTYYNFSKLNTKLDLEYTDSGMMIVLGPYESISKAEEFENLAVGNGADKTEVVAFEGDKRSSKSIKQLKKQGVN
ncbi:MAG: OmpA family protein [Chitinophagales bacterium]